jgi:hypothetical protein
MPINYYCDVEVQSNVLTTDTSNSRVGVNIASPATTFHANGVVRAGGTNGQSYVEIGDDSVFLYNSGVYRGSLDLYPNSSSGNLYISGANGTTVYFGAPTSWTTNISVQGQATLTTINNATSDTDKFLVSDSGTIKYRTGAEVRSDIGAGTGDGTVTVTSGASGNVAFFTSGTNITSTNKLYFDSANRRLSVDAGVSPSDTLHVGGNARVNSDLIVSGTGSIGSNLTVSGNINTGTNGNITIGQGGSFDAETSSEILIGSSTEVQIDGDPGASGQYIKSTGSSIEWANFPTTTQTIITSNFLDSGSTTSALRIPFNNLVETSSNQYYNCMDMPANGTVKRFRMHNTSGTLSTGFTTTMSIFKNGSTTPTSSGALTASSGQIEWEPSNYTFSKGDHLQFAYAKSAGSKYWQGVSASIIIEFTKV